MLDRWGALYGQVQHQLFAAYSKTGDVKTLDKIKSEMCARHGITARHFNAVSVSLKGKIASR
ncbi:MAG: IS200/IS605 family accessory protein TnpB-related protein, partial [Variovorax sp.]